jgi:hypothetical protein
VFVLFCTVTGSNKHIDSYTMSVPQRQLNLSVTEVCTVDAAGILYLHSKLPKLILLVRCPYFCHQILFQGYCNNYWKNVLIGVITDYVWGTDTFSRIQNDLLLNVLYFLHITPQRILCIKSIQWNNTQLFTR